MNAYIVIDSDNMEIETFWSKEPTDFETATMYAESVDGTVSTYTEDVYKITIPTGEEFTIKRVKR